MRDDIMAVQKELQELKEQSFAIEILNDYKKANKRLFSIILVVLCMWFATIGGFLCYISTVDYEEIIETAEVENESGNANACVGSNCNNGEINYGESDSKKNY